MSTDSSAIARNPSRPTFRKALTKEKETEYPRNRSNTGTSIPGSIKHASFLSRRHPATRTETPFPPIRQESQYQEKTQEIKSTRGGRCLVGCSANSCCCH